MSRFHKVLLAWLTCCVFGWIVLSPTAVGQDNNSPDQSAQIVRCVEASIASSSETVAPSAIIVIPPGECHTFKPRLYYVRSANDLQEIRSQSDVPNIGNKRILLLIHGWKRGKDEVRCQYDPRFGCIVSPDAPKEHIIKTWGNFIKFFYSDAAKTLRNHFALFAVRYNSNNHPYKGGRSSLDLDTTYGEKPSGGQLAELLDYLGNRELVIVAYSMGGLVARSYMAEYGGAGRTLGLITLGTPHHGSAFASPRGRHEMRDRPGCLRDIGARLAFLLTNTPGAQDLAHVRFGNSALENLEGDTDSKTVSFYGTIKKRVTHGLWYFLDQCLQAIGFQQSDGVVDAGSARANFSEDHIIYFEDYDHNQMRIGKGNDKCPDGVTATSKSPCLFVRIRDQICAFADLSCVNRPPIANAGPDQTVQVGSPVQLDGSGSTDPDGDPIKSYRWNILPRENSAQCVFKSSRNIAQPTIQPRREGRCTIELVVSDGKLNSAPDQVTITAKTDVIPPALIQDFLASDNEDGRSTLTWTNPSDRDLAEVIVRRKTGNYPTSHNDGDLVYQNTNPTPGAAVTHTDTGLTNGITYYYAVFSRDRAGNWNDQVVEGKNADTGRPGVLVSGLFAGTVETDDTGRVYLYRGGSQWEVISGDLGRGVMSLVKYNNTLYAGTYTGSLYRYENGTWVLMCNPDLVSDAILVLVVYRGNLYIGTFNGRLYRFEGPGSCTLIFDLDYGGFQSAYVEGGYLFLGSIGSSIYRFDGSTLEHIVDLGEAHVYDLVSYQGKLYAAVCGNTGNGLYESVDGINWVRVFTDCFRELEVFQGLLMMGEHLGGGEWALHWFNGTDRGAIWTGSGALASMIAQGNERLYIGTVETGRGGRVYAYDGNTVTPISEYLGGVYVLYFAPEGSGVSVNAVKVKPQSLRAFAFQRGQLIEFRVEGWDIGWMRVSVFDLSGKLVFHTDWVQNGFTWNLIDNRGQPLANGVYLYVVRVRGFDGREYVSEVRKLVILR
jgi:pimeloyl-ACP methyl ester carboxylesterase